MPGTNARKAIRDAFCALVEAELDGVTALAYEPEYLPDPPVVTMVASVFEQADRETGPVTDNVHGWELRVYVALSEPADGSTGAYEAGQHALEDLVPDIYSLVRAHPDINGTCEWASLSDSGAPVDFYHQAGQQYAMKSVQLRCAVFETVT